MSTVTTKGQATIPEEIRRLLSIKTGDKVVFLKTIPHKKEATIRVISQSNVVDQLAGSLHTRIPYISIAKVRKEAGRLLGGKYAINKP